MNSILNLRFGSLEKLFSAMQSNSYKNDASVANSRKRRASKKIYTSRGVAAQQNMMNRASWYDRACFRIEWFSEAIYEFYRQLPLASVWRQLLAKIEDLNRFWSSISFQANVVILTNIRFIFYELREDNSIMSVYVSANADIVIHNPLQKT